MKFSATHILNEIKFGKRRMKDSNKRRLQKNCRCSGNKRYQKNWKYISAILISIQNVHITYVPTRYLLHSFVIITIFITLLLMKDFLNYEFSTLLLWKLTYKRQNASFPQNLNGRNYFKFAQCASKSLCVQVSLQFQWCFHLGVLKKHFRLLVNISCHVLLLWLPFWNSCGMRRV